MREIVRDIVRERGEGERDRDFCENFISLKYEVLHLLIGGPVSHALL